jgi:fibronectin type 3 domain-containing protein
LNWVATTSTVAGYNVYRSDVSGGAYAKLNSQLITSTQYPDSTVLAGQNYFYVVTSADSNGAESVFSNEASAVIPTP